MVTLNKKQLKIESQSRYEKFELYIVKLHQKVTPGLYYLSFVFKGLLKVTMTGLYKSNYKLGNKTIGVAATQLHPKKFKKFQKQTNNPFKKNSLKTFYEIEKGRWQRPIEVSPRR